MMSRTVVSTLLTLTFLGTLPNRYDAAVQAQSTGRPRLTVTMVDDFEVSGAGDHANWRRAEWTTLRRRQPEAHPYETRFKVLSLHYRSVLSGWK